MQKFDTSRLKSEGKYTVGGKIKTAQSTSRNQDVLKSHNNNITSSQVIINRDIDENES